MNTYKPNATVVIREESWGKAILWAFIGYMLFGLALTFIFSGNWSDWMGWVSLVVGILCGIGKFMELQAPCPYCYRKIAFYPKSDDETKCSKCGHRSRIDMDNNLLVPLDTLPVPVQPVSPGGQSSGFGKAAAAGLAGLALGTLASEATAEEEMPQETQEDIDLDIDVA